MLTHEQIDQRRQERDRILLEIRTLKRRAWVIGQEILTGRVYVERGAGQLSLLDTAQARTIPLFHDEAPSPAVQEPAVALWRQSKRPGILPGLTPAGVKKALALLAAAPGGSLPKEEICARLGVPADVYMPSEVYYQSGNWVLKNAPKKLGRPRKQVPKTIPTPEEAIRAYLESCAALDKPGATLEQIGDFLAWASDTAEARGDLQRALHKAGAVEREGRYVLASAASAAGPAVSLRTRLLKRLDGSTYRGAAVLALLEGAPVAEVAAHLEQFEREGLLSARGPGANGKGFVLKEHERRKATLRPRVRINWHRGIEALDRFVAKRTRFTAAELIAELECSPREAEEAIRALRNTTAIMPSGEGWEVIEGFEVTGQVTQALIHWFSWLVIEAPQPLTPEQWAPLVELDRHLVVTLAHLSIKAKKIKTTPAGALVAVPEKKGKKK